MLKFKSLLLATALLLTSGMLVAQSIDLGRGELPVTIPATYDGSTPAPLIILLHGYTSSGAGQDSYMGFSRIADQYGFLLVAPDGDQESGGDRNRFWNASDACCNFFGSEVDDSGYILDIINAVKFEYNVDPDRVYLIGHSNGGFMSHRMACERGDRIHTIISLAGATYDNFEDCAVSGYPNILNVHGTSDNTIYFDGGEIFDESYPSASQTTASWAVRSGCDEEATYLGSLDLIGDDYDETANLEHLNCDAGNHVALWMIDDGSHSPSFPDGSLIN